LRTRCMKPVHALRFSGRHGLHRRWRGMGVELRTNYVMLRESQIRLRAADYRFIKAARCEGWASGPIRKIKNADPQQGAHETGWMALRRASYDGGRARGRPWDKERGGGSETTRTKK
jgi:hypothetical protein